MESLKTRKTTGTVENPARPQIPLCDIHNNIQLLEIFLEFGLESNFEYETPVDIKLFSS